MPSFGYIFALSYNCWEKYIEVIVFYRLQPLLWMWYTYWFESSQHVRSLSSKSRRYHWRYGPFNDPFIAWFRMCRYNVCSLIFRNSKASCNLFLPKLWTIPTATRWMGAMYIRIAWIACALLEKIERFERG